MSTKSPICINIIFEDLLSEAVIKRLIAQSGHPFVIGSCYHGRGNGFIKRNIRGFNKAARGMPFFVLTDCDNYSCVIDLINDYLPDKVHPNMLFRVAINEVESWLLADRDGLAHYLAADVNLIPINVDNIKDPKRCLINLAKKSRKKDLRTGIVPQIGSTATQGPYYNDCLIPFVKNFWDLNNACHHSESLSRAFNSIVKFRPKI